MSSATFNGSLSSTVTSGASVSQNITNTNASSPLNIVQVSVSTTPAALTIPASARMMIIQPASGTTQNLLIGGSGVALANMAALDPTNATYLAIPASATMDIAIASGTGTVTITYA